MYIAFKSCPQKITTANSKSCAYRCMHCCHLVLQKGRCRPKQVSNPWCQSNGCNKGTYSGQWHEQELCILHITFEQTLYSQFFKGPLQ